MDVVNTEQAEFWSELAPTWVELDQRLERVGGPPAQRALAKLELRPGQRVIDIGCGSGLSTVELAARVAPDGSALGVDIAEGMLEGARRRIAEQGVANAEFLCADVQVHDLGEATFDAAFSRFGVMFFKDPVAAFANVRRALRPGGQLVFVCWQTVFDNEWMLVPGMAAMGVLGAMPLPGPDEPGPFSLADPERIRSVLGSADFSSIEVEPHNDVVVYAEDAVPEQVDVSMKVGATREALREAPADKADEVRGAIEAAFREKVEGGELRLSRGVNVVRAVA